MQKKVLVISIGIVILVSLIIGGWGMLQNQQKITEKDFLHVENGSLITEDGRTVLLQGVNLGGWLIQESWMCPVSGENRKWANLDTLEVLESRFGYDKTAELIKAYQDNWITEKDIENIAKMGCNVIRVPFWYRNFMKDEQGTWITDNMDENPGFQRLDWVIGQAGKNGMYVILDMHGCPGGQSMDHCCGTLCRNDLYTDINCQNVMELLWSVIAARYKDNPVVAAYDIMNEPQNNSGYEGEHNYDPWQPESWEMTNKIYDQMIKAIREIDSRHVITVEGIWRVSNLPDPATMGWDNMMYQTHLYDDDATFEQQAQAMADTVKKYGVAGYVGEFQNLNGIAMCQNRNINWTTWTYKGTSTDADSFFWYFGEDVRDADIHNDSYELILAKWGEVLKTENFEKRRSVIRRMQEALRDE